MPSSQTTRRLLLLCALSLRSPLLLRRTLASRFRTVKKSARLILLIDLLSKRRCCPSHNWSALPKSRSAPIRLLSSHPSTQLHPAPKAYSHDPEQKERDIHLHFLQPVRLLLIQPLEARIFPHKVPESPYAAGIVRRQTGPLQALS